MNRIALILYFAFCAIKSWGQEIPFSHNVLLKGPLILYQPYVLKFDKDFRGYITFDDHVLPKRDDNSYDLISVKNGHLAIYDIENNQDTLLRQKVYVQFRDPEYVIYFSGKNSGDSINKTRVHNGTIKVEIPNNNISLSIPIANVSVGYYVNQTFEKLQLRNSYITHDIADKIFKSSTKLLILYVQIKTNGRLIDLKPAIYFLK